MNDHSDRPRAVFFCKFPPPNTGQTIGTELTRRLVERDLECVVFDNSGDQFIFGHSATSAARRLLELLRRMSGMLRYLRRENADVLYLVTAGSVGGHLRDALTILRGRRHVRRIVAHVRSGEFPRNFTRRWQRPLAKYVFSKVDCFIFLSQHLADKVADDLPSERRAVVFNCIDEEVRCSEREVAEKLTARGERETLRVLYLANMVPAKGYRDVAEAVHLVASRRPDLALEVDFAGAWPSPEDREAFVRLLEAKGLSAIARLHDGIGDRREVKRLLLETDVVVLPTYYPEAQPRSLIEAINAATPIIATREASIPEYIFDGVNGYLVDPRAPEQIAAALERLAEPATWRARAEAARRVYLEKFDPDVIQRALVEAFLGGPAKTP